MGWIVLWRFWKLDKHLLHNFTASVMRSPNSIFGTLQFTWICYKATTSSNNKLDCSGYFIIKQLICICLWYCFMVPAVCYASAMYWPNSWCLHLKKLNIQLFNLRMRREPQIINKGFLEIGRFRHCDSFTSISITSNRIWIQRSSHLLLWGNFKVNHSPMNRNVIRTDAFFSFNYALQQ